MSGEDSRPQVDWIIAYKMINYWNALSQVAGASFPAACIARPCLRRSGSNPSCREIAPNTLIRRRWVSHLSSLNPTILNVTRATRGESAIGNPPFPVRKTLGLNVRFKVHTVVDPMGRIQVMRRMMGLNVLTSKIQMRLNILSWWLSLRMKCLVLGLNSPSWRTVSASSNLLIVVL